jgi:hypothetical protein
MRMGMRRFTRLTNGFSKKIENHAAAVALFFMYYNFARVHKTLRYSPAMAAGVDNRLWEIKDIVEMIADYEKSKLIHYPLTGSESRKPSRAPPTARIHRDWRLARSPKYK